MLITFESGECGGKDTQIELLANRISSQGYSVKADLWEPGSTLKAEVIRLLLKNKHNSEFKFPGDFINTFDLGKYRAEFLEEKIPKIAAEYLNEAMEGLGWGIKYEVINFVLNNQFIEKGNLAHTINYLNNVEEIKKVDGHRPTPAELLFKEFFSEEKLNPEVQMYLFMAARNIIYHNVISDALKKYDVVIVNRSLDSTKVYQGHAQNPSLNNKIDELNAEATEGIVPDITILLDLSIEEVAKRKAVRSEKVKYSGITKDFFDEKELSFHQKIREGYLLEAEHFKNLPKDNGEYRRIKVVDALGSKEEVHERIWYEVMGHMKS